MYDTSPRDAILEVVEGASSVAERRLISVEKVQALFPAATDTAALEQIIDYVSAMVVGYCDLATDAIGTPATFAQEGLKATFLPTCVDRGSKLILPWRVPITVVVSVTEGDVTLTPDTDYRMLPGAMLERVCDDFPTCWSSSKIIVLFSAGWDLAGDGCAPDLEKLIFDQVKMEYSSRARDQGLLSEEVPEVYKVSYGDSRSWVGKSGLLVSLENYLAGQYKNRSV